MQELVVPCVTIVSEAEGAAEQQFEVDVTFPTAVTNNIVTVEIEPKGQMAIAADQTITLKATADDREVCEAKEVTVQHGATTERLRLKTGQLDDASSVVFEAIDAETREVLERQRARLDMVIRDDGFDI
jgi:GTPase